MNEIKIYIGLNDSVTQKQLFETDKYIDILKKVCRSYKTSFSYFTAEGGYFHEDGSYTQETTLILTLIDTEKDTVDEIAKDLCAFFHQESVMVTVTRLREYYYVKESVQGGL